MAGPVGLFLAGRCGEPKYQPACATVNPVTGLIQQLRKCLAATDAAYIVERFRERGRVAGIQGYREIRSYLKEWPCIQFGSNHVEG